jgi:hypothetical protein
VKWLALLLAIPLIANDTFVTKGAGGLVPVKTSRIVMESEDLEIGIHKITVNYVFRNDGDRDVDATVAFPLPEIDGGEMANEPVALPSERALNFVDFKVTAGSQPVAVQTEARAFSYDGREITTRLLSFGLPISPIVENYKALLDKLPLPTRKRLEKDGWIDCQSTPGTGCWAMWKARIQFYWTQHFKARSNVRVQHTYRPVVGGSYLAGTSNGAASDYCAGADALARIARVRQNMSPGPNDTFMFERRIQYILTTANNWRGPIGNFHLAVVADKPDDIVLTCTPGLSRVAPTRYELSRKDFHPDRELDLLILQKNQ